MPTNLFQDSSCDFASSTNTCCSNIIIYRYDLHVRVTVIDGHSGFLSGSNYKIQTRRNFCPLAITMLLNLKRLNLFVHHDISIILGIWNGFGMAPCNLCQALSDLAKEFDNMIVILQFPL